MMLIFLAYFREHIAAMTFTYNKKRFISAVAAVLATACLFTLPACKAKANPDDEQPSASPSEDPNAAIRPPEIHSDETQAPAVSETPIQPETSVPPVDEGVQPPDLAAGEAKDDDFFADAAFMGNSLMDGFRLFSGLTTCDYYAGTSATVVSATTKKTLALENGQYGTYVDGLLQKTYGKIYILLGINEIYLEPDNFKEMYGEMLDTIIAGQSDCDIYVMGLTPVSSAKSSSSDMFNMTRINSYNEKLRELAAEKGCYYMDLVGALAGSDGFLAAGETSDGIHFSNAVYQTWLEYVRTHYAS